MKRPVKIKRKEELEKCIREEKDGTVMKKLLFLKMVSEGGDLRETAKAFSIAATTGYKWGQRWNKMGYEGVKKNRFKCGPKPKLSEEDRGKLKEILKGKEWWLLKDVRNLIKERFGIDYSVTTTWRLLKKMGMKCSKPYPQDYRKPTNAKRIMWKRLKDASEELKKKDKF